MRSVEARQVESMEAEAVLQPEKGTSGAVGGCLSLAQSQAAGAALRGGGDDVDGRAGS